MCFDLVFVRWLLDALAAGCSVMCLDEWCVYLVLLLLVRWCNCLHRFCLLAIGWDDLVVSCGVVLLDVGVFVLVVVVG